MAEADIPAGRIRRTAPVVGLTARTAGEAVVESLRRRVRAGDAEDRRAEFHARTAERYADLLGHSKGVLMKVGQMLSFVSLGRSIPPEYQALYRQALGRLQADAPPMAPELAAATFEAEIGRRPEDVFAEWSPEPLAAASIGQVHAAQLPDGRRVAVKIQYPGAEQAIRSDLKNDELLTTFFALLRAIAEEVTERISEELDYEREAANQAEFASIYEGHPFVNVPHVLPEWSTRRVLTQELVEGLSWAEALDAPRHLRDAWGEVIYRFSIGSLRRFYLFNADPHPGNYIFHEDGRVSFLDFGCVRRFEPYQVKQMSEVVAAIGRRDAPRAWRAWVDMGAIDPNDGPGPEEVFDWAATSFELMLGDQPFTVTPEHVGAALAKEYSPVGPSGRVLRAMTIPAHVTFLSRIDTGIMAVLGELHATGQWLAIQREYDEHAPPITELGIADAAFWAQRAAASG